MADYLLDTNAYFALLEYLKSEKQNEEYEKVMSGNCYISLEDDISNGRNPKINVNVLEVDPRVIEEAEKFIQKALLHNFKSMDAMILGTAKAHSTETEQMIVVTGDKA